MSTTALDTPPADTPERDRRLSRLATQAAAFAVFGALGAGVYLNTLDGPFVFDDHHEVVENASIRDLSAGTLRAKPTRPLVNLTYALDYARSGLVPSAFHATNITLHVLNIWLLYVLAIAVSSDWRRTGGGDDLRRPQIVGLTAAGLLAVHPLMTEAVAFVSSRAELLGATGFLGAFLAGRRALHRPTTGWIVLTWVLFLASLAAKELAAMLPAVLLLYDRWLLNGTAGERRLRTRRVLAPMAAVVVGLVATRLWLLLRVEYASDAQLSWQAAIIQAEMVSRYLRLLLWPASLSVIHEVNLHVPLVSLRTLVAIASVVAVMYGLASLRRAHALAAFGVSWFLLMLVPPAGLAVLVQRSQHFAEHRAYLAGCGLLLCAGLAAEAAWRLHRRSRRAQVVVAVTLIAVLATLTVARNERWRHPLLLWGDAVRVAPRAWATQFNYAQALQDDGDFARAAAHYRQALAIKPNDPGTYQHLAICLIEEKQQTAAREALAQATRLAPDDLETRQVAVRYAAAFLGSADVAAACARLARAGGEYLPECRGRR